MAMTLIYPHTIKDLNETYRKKNDDWKITKEKK